MNAILVVLATAALGPAADLSFHPAGSGWWHFDTGAVRGKVKQDGVFQGIASLVHIASGDELLKAPGLCSYYRVFRGSQRLGGNARDWPTRARVLPDGGLEIVFLPAEDHPLELVAVHRWRDPQTLDVETTLRPQVDMPQAEVFVSSYFAAGFDAAVYLQPSRHQKGPPAIVPIDHGPLVEGTYLFFARDRQSAATAFDGRWEIPPHPVQWSVPRYFAGPLILRRRAADGLTVAMMSPPAECFALASPYNRAPADPVAGHGSLYQSLFGGDVKAGGSATARCRVLVGVFDDAELLRRYAAYLAETK